MTTTHLHPSAWGTARPQAWAQLPEALTQGLEACPLDWALAYTLQSLCPAPDPHEAAWVAAVSAAWRAGHACLEVHDPQGQARCQALPWADPQDPLSPLVWQAPGLYLRRAWAAEVTIRQAIRDRLTHSPEPESWPLAEWEARCWSGDPTPADTAQRQAARQALRQGFTLITGGPGTGKTHVVARILALRQAQALHTLGRPLRVGLAAPTGKAAARLSQALAQSARQLPPEWTVWPEQATTLHRALLNASPDQPLREDLWVIDEASMIDLELMARMLSALSPQTAVVMLGDPDQLASVDAGAVLAQLCAAPEVAAHRIHLSHSHRFEDHRGIGQWARLTQQGQAQALVAAWADLPPLQASDWGQHAVSRCDSPQDRPPALAEAIRAGWHDWLQWLAPLRDGLTGCTDDQALQGLDALSRLGVLCAVREGPRGVGALNAWVNELLGLGPADAAGWYGGRPVMVTQNLPQLGLMNGDVGLCLPREVNGQVQWRVAFAQPQNALHPVRWLPPSQVHPVETAWAITVHKAQGSEFQRVIIALPNSDSPILTREWLYTALTRARESVGLWASQPEGLALAAQRPTQRMGGLHR